MKRKLLKGNFTEKEFEIPEEKEEQREFEKAVISKLGGSVAMVRSDKLVDEETTEA